MVLLVFNGILQSLFILLLYNLSIQLLGKLDRLIEEWLVVEDELRVAGDRDLA